MTVTVYTKPGCVQCVATFRHLNNLNIPYETVDVSTDPVALEHIKRLGYLQAPVIVTGVTSWSGYDPDRINQHAHNMAHNEGE